MANVSLTSALKTTQSALPKKLLHTPFSGDWLPKLLGALGRFEHDQSVAATATVKKVATHPGKVKKFLIANATVAAATETLTFDVQVNGATILTFTPQVVNADTEANAVYDLLGLIIAGTVINVGDVISVIRTLANGSTVTASTVVLEWA